jgi:hypothetical protein
MSVFLLKLLGIAGTAKQPGHEGEIELSELRYQLDVPKGPGGSSGTGQLAAVKKWDVASGALRMALYKNTSFAEAVVTELSLSNQELTRFQFKKLVFRRIETISPRARHDCTSRIGDAGPGIRLHGREAAIRTAPQG